MRRREKFVLAAAFLSIGLLAVQYTILEWRYYAIVGLMIITYFVSAWALRDDLQRHEWLTVLPFPVIYTAAVALFYFLLPGAFLTRVIFLALFGVGMYGLYLTSNIFSVAKGRTIQLLYAAHAVALFFTLFTSMLLTNTIFSLRLPFYSNGALGFLIHFPLVMMSLWSIKLESFVGKEIFHKATLLTLVIAELISMLSLLPFPAWHSALFVMGILYIGLGVLQSQIRERLFHNTSNEYSLVAVFLAFIFFLLLPWK
ncbi:MAG: hypothetical protein COU63_04070 [Candidatus Pacebacteria bacterium CG10_big_fil_rev_8_21_14_0_10_36_11]|nr:hypothetical protein [Candidatus Pacearchaeota archaeon]OIP74072.1 MAG: hypothetical protein AUK08_02345 [Candidatus Pacebacteria bacterium CG2_30_36_39]PIR64439.1 MAG: hypothetical protein COU63_04070 [Candidatus Pacebacteria bacterium CG10_big_fil_rev_8_21_14_0_10_36_11]PJC42776.1 MAG: hypothetical protein CO040_02710 [Candidatus Pacebacteria bacterium CG_4_9_14_0_2_um_filter_36_8]